VGGVADQIDAAPVAGGGARRATGAHAVEAAQSPGALRVAGAAVARVALQIDALAGAVDQRAAAVGVAGPPGAELERAAGEAALAAVAGVDAHVHAGAVAQQLTLAGAGLDALAVGAGGARAAGDAAAAAVV